MKTETFNTEDEFVTFLMDFDKNKVKFWEYLGQLHSQYHEPLSSEGLMNLHQWAKIRLSFNDAKNAYQRGLKINHK